MSIPDQSNIKKKTTVALYIENAIFMKGVEAVIHSLDGFEVSFATTDFDLFLRSVNHERTIDICMLDLNIFDPSFRDNMERIRQLFPGTKIIILSNYDHSYSIIKALQQGANGHISKSADAAELHRALLSVRFTGQYVNEEVMDKKADPEHYQNYPLLTEMELQALTLMCTEMTYQEIADQLQLSVQMIEGYRDILFEKLNTQSRVGLIVCAHKIGITAPVHRPASPFLYTGQ